MLWTALQLAAGVLALVLAAVTLLPLSGRKEWWIRMWDFPRAQIAAALPVAMALALTLPAPLRWGVLAVLGACLAYQCWRILPYTPLARREMDFATEAAPGRDVRLLAANVLMENAQHAKVRDLVADTDPDVLLLMETDATWVAALEPVLARYPTVLREPRDNYYGLVFATRLRAAEARVVYLTTDDTPSVYAELSAPDGASFRFLGLHPRPPVPGEDTHERDAQILYSARFARNSDTPVVTMGDFNDAAWSDTSQRFKHVGGYLDPRIGRGLYASFDASHPLIRCPIDQLFVSEGVAMVAFGRGPLIGSDHFPMTATIRLDAELAARLNRPPAPLAGQARADVEKGVAAHRGRLKAAARRNDGRTR